MNKRLKVPGIVTIGILTLLTTLFWVGFELYRTVNSKPDPDVPASILAGFNSKVDTTLLDKVQQRVYMGDTQALP